MQHVRDKESPEPTISYNQKGSGLHDAALKRVMKPSTTIAEPQRTN